MVVATLLRLLYGARTHANARVGIKVTADAKTGAKKQANAEEKVETKAKAKREAEIDASRNKSIYENISTSIEINKITNHTRTQEYSNENSWRSSMDNEATRITKRFWFYFNPASIFFSFILATHVGSRHAGENR